MRVLVMGAGSVGGYYGAVLARTGHAVTFVARGAHLQAMRERGLEIRRPQESYRLQPVDAVATPAEAAHQPELIIFSVKSYDTAEAIEALRPVVGSTSAILTLQNGVDSADQLAAAFGDERVLVGTTFINAAVPEPGVVVDRGAVIRSTLAERRGLVTTRLTAVAEALSAAGVEVIVQTDPQIGPWQKFILLAAHATLTSATGETVGTIRAVAEGAALYRQLMAETYAVARASGVPLPSEIVDQQLDFIMTMPAIGRSSLANDFAAGRRVELEQLTGSVVRRGRAVGVPTPGFDALYAVLKVRALATGQR
jgi:2-dehydropantoate 2-reductase